MTWSQPCGCLNVKTPISYLIVRNHLCPHFMTVFRLYQLNRKKKIFLPNYQFYLEPVIRGIFGQGQYRHETISITSQTVKQCLSPPPQICIPHCLVICLFRYITQSGEETMGLFYFDNKISKRWPRLYIALWSIPRFLAKIHCAGYHPVGCGHIIGYSTPRNESSKLAPKHVSTWDKQSRAAVH